MSIKLNIIEYELALTSLHITRSIVGGNLYTTLDEYIPGTTLRGALGEKFINLYCSDIDYFKRHRCSGCSYVDCIFGKMFLDNEHGRGVYFHFGDIVNRSELEKQVITHVTIDRRIKSAVKGRLFSYEVLLPKDADTILVKSRAVIVSQTPTLVEEKLDDIHKALRDCIKSLIGTAIGGKKSWGVGYVKSVNITNEYEATIEKEEVDEEVALVTRTPLPITEESLDDTVFKALKDLYFSLFKGTCEFKVKVDITSDYTLSLMTSWDLAKNRVRDSTYVLMTDKMLLRIKNPAPELGVIIKLLKYIGLCPSGKWFTKTGYGVMEVLES